MISPALVLSALLWLSPYYGDRGELPADRAARLEPVAEAISAVARNRVEVALLLALGTHESHFSALVLAGRCTEIGPRACDSGRARGVWQLHREACPRAWELPDGSRESLAEEARCVVSLLRWGAHQGTERALTPLHAALSAYAGHGPTWPGAELRVRTTRKLLARLEGR